MFGAISMRKQNGGKQELSEHYDSFESDSDMSSGSVSSPTSWEGGFLSKALAAVSSDLEPINEFVLCDSEITQYRGLNYRQSEAEVIGTSDDGGQKNTIQYTKFVDKATATKLTRDYACYDLALDPGIGHSRKYPANLNFGNAVPSDGLLDHCGAKSGREFKKLSKISHSKLFVEKNGGLEVSRESRKQSRHGILPYDSNTVPCLFDDGFLNASFIRGYDGSPARYIAAEAPLPGSIHRFLHAILEQNVGCIVTLCQNNENECDPYWPLEVGETVKYAGVQVVLKEKEEVSEGLVKRTLIISSSLHSRVVTQIHFQGWQDMSAPSGKSTMEQVLSVIDHVEKIEKYMENSGPLLVHCSAGVGRTGVFISIHLVHEMMKESAASPFAISIGKLVLYLRSQRPMMVYTSEQYDSLYRLAHHRSKSTPPGLNDIRVI